MLFGFFKMSYNARIGDGFNLANPTLKKTNNLKTKT